jgi:glycosyltransferase involved in cell wall biosynthesis
MRRNVLALSFLFPNAAHPGYGIFVLNRLKAVQRFCNLRVVAPIQWIPIVGALLGRDSKSIPAKESIEGVEVFHPRFAVVPRYMKWLDSITYFFAARRIVRALEADESFVFDLVDVHWTYPDIVAAYFLARQRGKKFVVTLRGHEAFYDEEISLRRWLVSYFLRRADFVIALSTELRDKAIRLGVRAERTSVVLNGVNLGRFRYMDRADSRRELGLAPIGTVIISVGRLTEKKGHHEIVKILPALADKGPIDFYIIGGVNREDDFGPTLRKLIGDLKLPNVHILDRVPQDQLPLWYGAADLFCLATKSEGCPNVVLEALACGTPVIATDAGAIGELVMQGEDGAVVSSRDVSALTAVVRGALERAWDRHAIAARMEARSWNACAERVREVYELALQ